MAAVTVHSNFGAQENEVCHCFHCFPIYLTWSDRTGCHDLSFWMLSFKPVFSFSFFIFIKRLFSSSSLSTISLVLSQHLKLLIFLQAILIPPYDSFSLAFYLMYPAYKLNNQGDIYWAWPPEQDPVFPTVSPSNQEACTSLLSSSIRRQTEWKVQSQKTNQNDHTDYSFV